jgi:mannose-6-phosphate isomerase-like protein (cupin superfamily)
VRVRLRALAGSQHAIYRLAPGLLLVRKPRGHHEAAHCHPYRQRWRVLRGELIVGLGTRRVRLHPGSRPLLVAAGRVHDTVAVRGTWLLVESGLVEVSRCDAPRRRE